MAIFHLEVKKISRGKGRSCIAAGAYIMGKKFNELDAENNVIKTFNYNKKDEVYQPHLNTVNFVCFVPAFLASAVPFC